MNNLRAWCVVLLVAAAGNASGQVAIDDVQKLREHMLKGRLAGYKYLYDELSSSRVASESFADFFTRKGLDADDQARIKTAGEYSEQTWTEVAAKTVLQQRFITLAKTKTTELTGILEIYLPPIDAWTASSVLNNYDNENPFTGPYIESTDYGGWASSSDPASVAEGVPSPVGGLSVATVADGLAKFLVSRTKAELSIAFFERFKKVIDRFPEFEVLFPATSKFMEQIDAVNYASFLQVLKAAFERDIKDLASNARDLRELDKAKDCGQLTGDAQNDCNDRVDKIRALFYEEEEIRLRGEILISASILIEHLIRGTNAADILDAMVADKDLKKGTHNLSDAVRIAQLFSQSLRSTKEDEMWVKRVQVNRCVKEIRRPSSRLRPAVRLSVSDRRLVVASVAR